MTDNGSLPPSETYEDVSFTTRLHSLTPEIYVTVTLIAVNAAIFIMMVINGVGIIDPNTKDLLRWGADFAPKTTNGEWWRLLTSCFVHIGVVHIAMNMLVLWDIGQFMERLFGHTYFLITYLFAGITGSLLSTTLHNGNVSAGASGAIFGLYGALVAVLIFNKVTAIPKGVLNRLVQYAAVFILINVAYGAMNSNIDQFGHLGGFLGGFLLGFFFVHPLTREGRANVRVRAVFGVLLAIAIIGIGIATVPRTVNLESEFQNIDSIDADCTKRLNVALNRYEDHEITGVEFAGIIDSDIMPKIREVNRRLESFKRVPEWQKPPLDKAREYFARQQASLPDLADAARKDDIIKFSATMKILNKPDDKEGENAP